MRWKHARSKRKKSQTVKLALLVFILMICFLLFSRLFRFTADLFKPINPSGEETRNYMWNGKFNINLLLRASDIAIFSYNPKEKTIAIIALPGEMFLQVPGGFGSWQLRSIYDLGESQEGLGGDRLLVQTLTSALAIPIDGFADFSHTKNVKSSADTVRKLRENLFSGINLLSSIRTNLTMWELIRLKWEMGGVRFDKVKELDLGQMNILDQQTLADGSRVLTGDPVKLDSVLGEFTDSTIISEHKSIAIFNATEVAGLAQKWARILVNMGANVIITANASEVMQQTQIFGEPSATYNRLRQIFGSNDKIGQGSNSSLSRAEINIYLGEDMIKK